MNHTPDHEDDRMRFVWSHPFPVPVRPSLSLPITGCYINLQECGAPRLGVNLTNINGLDAGLMRNDDSACCLAQATPATISNMERTRDSA
jgi:hypothetical protein